MSKVGIKKSGLSRRDFLRLMGAAGVGIAFTPFIPFGNFMPNPNQVSLDKAPLLLTKKTAIGTELYQADAKTVPINYGETITYPLTKDPVLDAEPFRKWQFIRLPEELGGSKNDVSAFRAFSNICLHLWCLWEYKSERTQGECPCHGSMYDPSTGKAFAGPAAVQAAPSNVLPMLDLEVDDDDLLWILPPKLNVNDNGVIGYGRYL